MAPEVFNRDYDQKADLYSIGILLYELQVGEPPFGYIESIKQAQGYADQIGHSEFIENIEPETQHLFSKLFCLED